MTVALNPTSIAANGTSTSTATATVKDAQGHLLTGDTIAFSSSDAGEQVSTTTNHNDGTYSATITSSTTVGTPTITAKDTSVTPTILKDTSSVTPNVSGAATLTQTAGTAGTVTVALSPASVVANGTSTSTATATVRDSSGHALTAETVTFASSDAGEHISSTTNHGDGTYTATITSSTRSGQATITATDTSASPNVSGTATLTQTPGPATSVTVALNPASIVANGTSTSTATATIKDANGNAVPMDVVAFATSDAGQHLGVVANHTDGTYTVTITSSTTVGQATITATDSSVTPNVSGTATLTQTAGPAATVTVALNPASIAADGSSTSTATATVRDAQGHLLTGDTVAFSSSDSGEHVSATTNHNDGTYSAVVTASTTAGPATITAKDSSVTPNVSGTATLTQTTVPTGGTIQGIVRDASSNPVAGAAVGVCSVSGQGGVAAAESANAVTGGESCTTATTGAAGTWSVTGQPAGFYVATINPPATGPDSSAQSASVSGTLVTNGTLELDATLVVPVPLPSGTSITSTSGVATSGVPTVFWGSPATLITHGCAGGTATFKVSATNTDTGQAGSVTGSFTEGPAGTFTATIPPLMPLHGPATVTISFNCAGVPSQVSFTIYIDPSGTVVDQNNNPVSGATITLLSAPTATGTFTAVPNGSAVMSPGNRNNPDTTNSAGQFGWDVLAGFYEVTASKAGCSPATSSVLTIPPPVTGLTLTLQCGANQGTTTITGNVGGTLSLTVANSTPTLGAFVAGVAGTYTTSTAATVLSTAGSASLTVYDSSSTATGHLVNGTFALAQPLQANATDAAHPTGVFAPVGSTASPLTLLTYTNPVSNDAVTINFQQLIGATDPLRTGTYSKTLTFTLSSSTL